MQFRHRLGGGLRHPTTSIPLLLLLLLPLCSDAIPGGQRHTFRENCADEHDKDVVECRVSLVDCQLDMEKLFPPGAAGAFPGEAHDVRIEHFTKAITRLGGGTTKEEEAKESVGDHQLLVDISWQTQPNNSTRALGAFLLEVEGENGRRHACFLLNISGTNWTEETVASSPRLHFSTDSLFSFGQNYEIELYSLPERNAGSGPSVHSRFATPHNPNPAAISGAMLATNCSRQSNQFASKWTAGFRHIYVHSAARILQVEFVGAPPQYCFEQYEVRLLDESGMELLYSGTVSAGEMATQKNGTLILGQYNFTDLEYDKSYIPSVIPVERAADGRCLCPVFGTDPYDVKVVCSCVAADWKPIRMNRPDVVKLCPGCPLNGSGILQPIAGPSDHSDKMNAIAAKTNILWILLLVFNALFLLVIFMLVIAYLRCRLGGTLPSKGDASQFRRIRFVPSSGAKPNGTASACAASGGQNPLAIRTNLALGTVSAGPFSAHIPLIGATEESEEMASAAAIGSPSPLSLLIVYAHDCPAHERAVMALAEFLRDTFHVVVQLDRWATAQIEANATDWLSASVISADRVLIINSAGAWERYRTKSCSQGRWAVERKEADLLDHIFSAHIDMALQHHSIVSARFAYSPCADHHHSTLPMLQGRLQYVLPEHIWPLVSAVFGRNMRQDARLSEAALAANESLARMGQWVKEVERMCAEEPNWLANSHCRRRMVVHGIEGGMEEKETIIGMDETSRMEAEGEEEENAEEIGHRMMQIVDETKEEDEVEDEEEEGEGKMEASAFLMLEEKPGKPAAGASGKMDSGIFEWAGSDEESGGGGSINKHRCMTNSPQKTVATPAVLPPCSANAGGEADSGVVVTTTDGVAAPMPENDGGGKGAEKRMPSSPLHAGAPCQPPPPLFAAAV